MADLYLLKSINQDPLDHSPYDMCEIGKWEEVISWAKAGVIEKGDEIYKLEKVELPDDLAEGAKE